MKRRKFLVDTSLAAFSIAAIGKIKWDGNTYTGTDPTTTDILGPFYRPGAPFRTELVQLGTKGQVLHVSGTVFGKDGITPAKNSLVEIWHCNEDGVYDNVSDQYIYRACCKTESDGKYHFRTIMPVPYKASATLIRPAHIHMRISGTADQDLVTQIYFKGDKFIPGDPSSSDPKSLNRILETSVNEKKERTVKFDIYLKAAYVPDDVSFNKIAGLYEMSDKTMGEFYRREDELFAKLNGQIVEALAYMGNNSFEGGLGQTKAQFELLSNGGARVKISYLDDDRKTVNIEGTKMLKYPE